MCFVSTPAVLERFVTIEREILQIERSVQANELNANVDGRQEEGMLKDLNFISKCFHFDVISLFVQNSKLHINLLLKCVI